MLELTDPACAGVLDLLDGSRTETGLLRTAERCGIDRHQAALLVQSLRAAGLVIDAHLLRPGGPSVPGLPPAARARLADEAAALVLTEPARSPSPATRLRRRLAAQVIVTGTSQLAVPIAATLAMAGVGHLDPHVQGTTDVGDATPAGLLPTDACRPRGVAAADAIRRVAPGVRLDPLRPGRATFVVLVGSPVPAELTALAYGRRRLAHLSVSLREGTVVVGPLVRPGTSPCLNCLDLHRQDRDPAWRVVAAQLSEGSDRPGPVTATTVLAATAYAAAEVLTHIDGETPATVGATVEISRAGETRRRRWTLHPQCDCRRR
jgi:hypothetical protein